MSRPSWGREREEAAGLVEQVATLYRLDHSHPHHRCSARGLLRTPLQAGRQPGGPPGGWEEGGGPPPHPGQPHNHRRGPREAAGGLPSPARRHEGAEGGGPVGCVGGPGGPGGPGPGPPAARAPELRAGAFPSIQALDSRAQTFINVSYRVIPSIFQLIKFVGKKQTILQGVFFYWSPLNQA